MAAVPTIVSETAQKLVNRKYSGDQAQADALKVVHQGLYALMTLPVPVEIEQQIQMLATAIGDATRAMTQTSHFPAVTEATIWGAARKVEMVTNMILEAGGGMPELTRCCPCCGTELLPSIVQGRDGLSSLELHCLECHYSAPRKVAGAV